jgi:hypothetical protein
MTEEAPGIRQSGVALKPPQVAEAGTLRKRRDTTPAGRVGRASATELLQSLSSGLVAGIVRGAERQPLKKPGHKWASTQSIRITGVLSRPPVGRSVSLEGVPP